MYVVSEYAVTELPVFSVTTQPEARFPWCIELRHKSGGKIKRWYYGANDFPCRSIEWQESEKGSLNASMLFERLNFPIYYGSELIISYNGVRKYRGYVSNVPDPRGGKVKVSPFRERLKQLTYTDTFTNQTFPTILQTTLNSMSSNSGVLYNASLTKFTSTEQYSPIYNYQFARKIIDDYYKLEDDAYEGVDPDGFQFILTRESDVTDNIYSGQGQPFQSFDVQKDYSKIKQTYINTFQKSSDASGQKNFLGTVPNGTTYVNIDLENIIGKIEKNINAPDNISSSQALALQQAKLDAIRVPTRGKIKGLDITRHELRIGQKVRVFSDLEFQFKTIIDCDSTDNWTGTLSLSTQAVEGSNSITWNSANTIYYDFTEIKHYKGVEKMSFMIKSDVIGSYLEVNTGSTYTSGTAALAGYSLGSYGLGSYSVDSEGSTGSISSTAFYEDATRIFIEAPNVWNLVEIESTNAFRYFGIKRVDGNSIDATCLIDDIRIYGYFQESYELNVIKMSYKLNKSNDKLYDVTLGDYDPQANDMLFDIEKRIQAIEETQST